jgi:hypothetical protein
VGPEPFGFAQGRPSGRADAAYGIEASAYQACGGYLAPRRTSHLGLSTEPASVGVTLDPKSAPHRFGGP